MAPLRRFTPRGNSDRGGGNYRGGASNGGDDRKDQRRSADRESPPNNGNSYPRGPRNRGGRAHSNPLGPNINNRGGRVDRQQHANPRGQHGGRYNDNGSGAIKSTRNPRNPRNTFGPSTDRDGDLKMQEARQAAINEGSQVNVREPGDVEMSGIAPKIGGKPGEVPVAVSGWTDSNASTNKDGGISSLKQWLERKSAEKGKQPLKLKYPQREGDILVFWTPKHLVPRLTHLNGFTWAGSRLTIEEGQPGDFSGSSTTQALSADTQDIRAVMEQFLNQRYNASEKLLNLSAMFSDPVVMALGVNENYNTSSKFFPALMKVCDISFKDATSKKNAVVSVTLANNGLNSIAQVTTLSQTFPDLKNIDLSYNQIHDLKALQAWRWKFRHVEHIVLTGNQIENTDYKPTILKWFPKLRLINGQVIRSEQEVAAGSAKLPLHVLAADFRDEARIAETFIRSFFPAYDTDRPSLLGAYYDEHSTFSLSVNTSAPRAADAEVRGHGWDPYIRTSRNLLKITHLPSRLNRAYTGVPEIRQIWQSLPKTKHPDLAQDFSKWNIECHSIPDVPDQNNSGVGVTGLLITIHGQFEEFTQHNQPNIAPRSFDRTFVLGPGHTSTGVRVVSDIVCLRAWGGSEAWLPNPDGTQEQTHPEAVNGIGDVTLNKPMEQLMMEKMILDFSQKTNLNLQYARMCLDSGQWNPERALQNFEQSKDQLGPEAWL